MRQKLPNNSGFSPQVGVSIPLLGKGSPDQGSQRVSGAVKEKDQKDNRDNRNYKMPLRLRTTLRNKTTAETQSELNKVESFLGSKPLAAISKTYYSLRDEMSQLTKELKRRKG
jgi:hypothetical protein